MKKLLLIVLAVLGFATVIVGIGAAGYYCGNWIKDEIKKNEKPTPQIQSLLEHNILDWEV